MVRAITYLMAASVGLVIAMALALPSLLHVETPPEPPPTVVVERAAPQPEPGGIRPPKPADNQTLLAFEAPAGSLVAIVNGQRIGELQRTMQVDISPFVRSGENTLRLVWNSTTDANLVITYAARAGAPREVIRAYVTPAESLQPSERTVTFFL